MPKMSSKKIIIVGDAGVGKTNFVRMLKENGFEKKYIATVGAEVHPHSFDGRNIYTIWDVGGDPKYADLIDGYLNDVDMAIVMYDVNRKSTYESIHSYWIPKLTTTNILLVGNKSDTHGNPGISVKTGEGVPEIIEKMKQQL